MDAAIADLAFKHRRSISGEIQFLMEEALKNTANSPIYADRNPRPVMGETSV
jgi:hypothetical protein